MLHCFVHASHHNPCTGARCNFLIGLRGFSIISDIAWEMHARFEHWMRQQWWKRHFPVSNTTMQKFGKGINSKIGGILNQLKSIQSKQWQNLNYCQRSRTRVVYHSDQSIIAQTTRSAWKQATSISCTAWHISGMIMKAHYALSTAWGSEIHLWMLMVLNG